MAYERRTFSDTAVATTLGGAINDSVEAFTIASATGWPDGSGGDFFASITSTAGAIELVRCQSRTSTTITVRSGGRGYGSTVATAYSGTEVVKHVYSAEYDANEANLAVAKTVGKIAAAGDLLYGDAINSLEKLTKGTSGTFLKQGASIPAWTALASADISDLAEFISDTAGAMTTGNTETGITVSYQDADNTIDYVVNTDGTTIQVTGGNLERMALTGDVTAAAGSGVTSIAADAVGAAEIAADAVGVTELAAAVAGDGLSGGGGSALEVNVDGTTIEIAADTLQVGSIAVSQVDADAGTSWTPTLTGTGAGIGNGTVSGNYYKIGRLVHAEALITYGTTTNYGTDTFLTVGGLPFATAATIPTVGHGYFHDTSTGINWPVHWPIAAGGTGGDVENFANFNDIVFANAMDPTHPVDPVATDYVVLEITYIAAS